MHTKPEGWGNFSLTKTQIFLAIVLTGFLLYGLVLLSFTGISFFSLRPNEAVNQYATAVSGLIGTAVTVIGVAFLLYAYKDQKAQAQFEAYNKLYEDLLNDINSIQYRKKYKKKPSGPGDSELFQGVDALFNYEGDESATPSSVLNHLNLILISFKHITDFLDQPDNAISHKKQLLDKVYLLYLAKIFWPCDNISTHYRNRIIKANWGYYKTLFYHFDLMTNRAYRYLIGKEVISYPIPNCSIETLLKIDYTQPGQVDFLTPAVRSILSCNYDTIETYWLSRPIILNRYTYPSLVRDMIVRIWGESTVADSLIDKIDHGPFLLVRRGIIRFRSACSAFWKNAPDKRRGTRAPADK